MPPRQGGIPVPERLLGPPPEGLDAHSLGYAVHVWPTGQEPESEGSYERLMNLGIDGYMASEPGRLHAFLCAEKDRARTEAIAARPSRRRSARRS